MGVCLCFVNRSGSNYVSRCLSSAGKFPRAREYFLKSNLLRFQNGSGDLSGVFAAIVQRHSDHGVFAAKFGYSQFALFESRGFLDAAFEQKRVIFLKRRDTLAQAISLEIASQNKRWKISKDEALDERDLNYSRKRIELKVAGIRHKQDRFETFFADRGQTPFTVIYEDFVDHPVETLGAIGEFLGRELPGDPAVLKSKHASDPLKDAWRRRFLDGN